MTIQTARANRPGRLLVHLDALAGIDDLAGDPGEGIDHREDGETAFLLGDFDRLLDQGPGNAVLAQRLLDFLGVAAQRRDHRLLDRLDEGVAALVSFLDQRLDGLADFAEGVMDVRGVFPRKLDDLGRVPHDVVRTDRLEPEGLDADAAAADLRIPDEHAGGEGLAADLGPAGRVDEEAEHVLLPAVQAGRPVEAFRRGLEADGEFLDHGQQVGVEKPRVAGGVDRAELAALGEQLQGLRVPAAGSRRTRGTAVSGREAIDGVLGHAGQAGKAGQTTNRSSSKAPSLPASSIRPSPATDRTFNVRGGCQISRVCCFCHWTCCESTPSDGKHSSGVRRKSSLDARVRFMDCSLGNGL